MGNRVPDNCSAFVEPEPPKSLYQTEGMRELLNSRHRIVANGSFEYWFSAVADSPSSAVVLMRFFRGILAFGTVFDTTHPQYPFQSS
jgi:hypothetical protein